MLGGSFEAVHDEIDSWCFLAAISKFLDLFDDIFENFTTILPAKYDEVTPQEVATKQTHLTLSQQEELATMLSQFPRLFDGKLKHYPHKKVHLHP